jgi:hypothetical protein
MDCLVPDSYEATLWHDSPSSTRISALPNIWRMPRVRYAQYMASTIGPAVTSHQVGLNVVLISKSQGGEAIYFLAS